MSSLVTSININNNDIDDIDEHKKRDHHKSENYTHDNNIDNIGLITPHNIINDNDDLIIPVLKLDNTISSTSIHTPNFHTARTEKTNKPLQSMITLNTLPLPNDVIDHHVNTNTENTPTVGINHTITSRPSTMRGHKKRNSIFDFFTEQKDESNIEFKSDIENWSEKFSSVLFDKQDQSYIESETRKILYVPEDDYTHIENKMNNSIVTDEIVKNMAPLVAISQKKSSELDEILKLKEVIRMEEIKPFLDDFQDIVQDDTMILGSLSLEDVEMEERKMEEMRLQSMREEVEKQRLRDLEIASREIDARERILALQNEVQNDLQRRQEIIYEQHQQNLREQQTAFREAETQLIQALHEREGSVSRYFGQINEADSKYGAVKGRRYQVDWALCPRSVRISVDALRAVKNKIPKGRYVVMATLYDRIGGHPLRWSMLESIKWTGSTPFPVRHEARFHDIDMSFAQKKNRIFLAFPSEKETRPSMCMIYELFLCRGKHSKVDRVVGWGAFPICDANFNLISGSYKCPLLRGEMDPNITKFEQFESLMAENLDFWLCNLYFNIQPLPRFMNGQKEYTVELNFTSNLLQLRQREDEDDIESDIDDLDVEIVKKKRVSISRKNIKKDEDDDFDERKYSEFVESDDEYYESDNEDSKLLSKDYGKENYMLASNFSKKQLNSTSNLPTVTALASTHSIQPPPLLATSSRIPLDKFDKNQLSNTNLLFKPPVMAKISSVMLTLSPSAPILPPGVTSPNNNLFESPMFPNSTKFTSPPAHRRAASNTSFKRMLSLNSNTKPFVSQSTLLQNISIAPSPRSTRERKDSEDVTLAVDLLSKSVTSEKSKKKAAADSFKKNLSSFEAKSEVKTLFTEHNKSMFAEDIDETAHMSQVHQMAHLDKYKFSVLDEHDNSPHGALEKLNYIRSELVDDLALTKWQTLDFWTMIFFICLMFYFRIFAHYVAQYLWLSSIRVPITNFSPNYASINLEYPTVNIGVSVEIGMVMIGPLINVGLFVGLMVMGYLWQKFLHFFPVMGSRLSSAYGINMILDPILILIVDVCSGNYNGDAFKLYNYFYTQEGSGVPGIILIVFFDAILLFVSSFLFYNYLLIIHMNGRMLDVYHRLHGQNSSFFLPDDMEISLRNLRWILTQAKRWTGFHGSVRKIAITSYIVKDHNDPDYEECSIHVAIYTQDINGQRQLYRQFLRRPDGAILELFDMHFEDSKTELKNDFRALELLLSRASIALTTPRNLLSSPRKSDDINTPHNILSSPRKNESTMYAKQQNFDDEKEL